MVYALWGGDDFTDRAAVPDRWDVILGVHLHRAGAGSDAPHHRADHADRRACCSSLYAMLGPYLPPPWTHRGYDFSRLVGHLFITLEGIFGVAVDVSATLIIMFTIYGAVPAAFRRRQVLHRFLARR